MTLSEYLLPSTGFEPAYLKLYRTAELLQRTKQVLEELGQYYICPRDYVGDRLANKTATCKTGRYAQVSSYFPHFLERKIVCAVGKAPTQFSFPCATYAVCFAKTLILVNLIVVWKLRLNGWRIWLD